MRIEADRDKCIGAGQCVLTAPDVFDQSEDDGVVRLLNPSPDESYRDAAEDAAMLCPASAIAVGD